MATQEELLKQGYSLINGQPYDSSGNLVTIPVDSLNNKTTPIEVPNPPENKVPVPPITPPDNNTQLSDYEKLLQTYIKGDNQPPSLTDAYKTEEQNAGISQKQQEVNTLQSQIGDISARVKSAIQTVESQSGGKDVTSTFLGRQQQEINRQATIQLLPLQAQLDAAQGNLTAAQNKLDTLFKLKVEDATNQYNYQKDLRDRVLSYASTKEQRILEQQQKEDDRKYQEGQDFIKEQQSWAATAIENGQGNLVQKIYNAKDRNELAQIVGGLNQQKVIPTNKDELLSPSEIKTLQDLGYTDVSYGDTKQGYADKLATAKQAQENINEIKALKDNGASKEEVENKVKNLLGTESIPEDVQKLIDSIYNTGKQSYLDKVAQYGLLGALFH